MKRKTAHTDGDSVYRTSKSMQTAILVLWKSEEEVEIRLRLPAKGNWQITMKWVVVEGVVFLNVS